MNLRRWSSHAREQLSLSQCLLQISYSSTSHCEIRSRHPALHLWPQSVGIIPPLLPCPLAPSPVPGVGLKALQSQEATFQPHPSDADVKDQLKCGCCGPGLPGTLAAHPKPSTVLSPALGQKQERDFCSSQVCSGAESV